MGVRPFEIAILDRQVEDLRRRLEAARFPGSIDDYDWQDGTDASYLRDIVEDWRTRYNWRSREREFNRLRHYVARIQGIDIHFIRAAPPRQKAIPLLLLHGWPSSFVQMLDVIPLLVEERNDGTPSFDVIAASLPGYPFSSFPKMSGIGFARIADLMTELMATVLGYERFAVRGSDHGGLVMQQMGLKYPGNLIGLHRSGITPFASPVPSDLDDAEKQYQAEVARWAITETAYARLQAQRPETLVPALCDSPVGLASWILEKFQRWGDCGGDDPDAQFGRDRLLDNLSLHWFTGSGAASTRLYREAAKDQGVQGRVEVPTAILMPLRDGATVPAPISWCQRSYNVQRFTIMPRGGHFPEWEVPNVVADDMREFFASLR